ncbi:AraC family transcriptional regulator [Bradyrhizobium sp. JYMT SZCCT0180]|uniref:AraC family transcriptional regulator n=1 Tax=Bradyrhizobium sp. JYMT SZCCT0180 TaxID=2807666 RepID=UPI001BAD63F1|nr:AraC family transcriptional regulator [Bradyrhizobium sp. JYMT SZCCT0180]MBR1211360.1 AraC family transcriptional regulator [Bradyrhizobium sp. JYMT SZCCT0180]
MDHATVAPNGDLAFRFLTDEWPERDRIAVIRDLFARAICRFELEPSPDHRVFGEAKLRAMPGLGLAHLTSSPAQVWRAPTDNDLIFTVWFAGANSLKHCGRETAIGEGDAFLTMSTERSAWTFSDAQFLSFRLPAREIAARVPDVENRVGRKIRRDTAALKLLTSYAATLQDASATATPELRQLAVTHIYDLVSLTLGATGDAADVARERGARAARLSAIKADIVENISRADLSVASIAARHRLPVRYVQRLFETEGTSFTQFVLEQRLARARQILINPQLAHFKMSMVAIEAGFSNMSYFYETFRRRYGASPSDVRAEARRDN